MQQDLTCAKCSEFSNKILVMECEHSLCVPCASKYLSTHSQSGRVAQIQCQICGCVSNLHPSSYSHLMSKENDHIRTQAYDKYRPPQQDNTEIQTQSMLFCMDCERTCFSIDDYLNGMHSGHTVKNVRKSHSVLKGLLGELEQRVRQRIQLSVSQSAKLIERKKELVQNFGSMKKDLQVHFQKIRAILAEKQLQLQSSLQQAMTKMFSQVDYSSIQVRHYLRKCEDLQRQIQQHKAQPKVRGFNYYSNRKQTILQQVNIPIQNISRQTLSNIQCVTSNFQSIVDAIQAVKRMKLQYGEVMNVNIAKQNLIDDFFEAKRNEVFNQTVKKDFRNHTLTSVKSMESLKVDMPGNNKLKSQKSLDDRLKNLQALIGRRSPNSRNVLSDPIFKHL